MLSNKIRCRTADWEPFGDSLNNAQNHGFYYFDKIRKLFSPFLLFMLFYCISEGKILT